MNEATPHNGGWCPVYRSHEDQRWCDNRCAWDTDWLASSANAYQGSRGGSQYSTSDAYGRDRAWVYVPRGADVKEVIKDYNRGIRYNALPEKKSEQESPSHYARLDPQPIDIIEKWGLGFHLACALKYIARAGHKEGNSAAADLSKAEWYIRRARQSLDSKTVGEGKK